MAPAENALGSKGRGYRQLDFEGFEILVGKADADNDRLTFGIAEPRDFWFHVAGPAGSHVVVRNPLELDELPRPVLERAAELAAWHSKARGARGKVEVHVCRIADIRKPRGIRARTSTTKEVGRRQGLPPRARRNGQTRNGLITTDQQQHRGVWGDEVPPE